MKIAALQMDIRWEDRQTNYEYVSPFARQAAQEGADLLVLPEMFSTGFLMNPAVTAESRDGETYKFICDLAKSNDIAVIAGIVFTEESGLGVNSALAVDRQGRELECYAKTHLYSVLDEHAHHRAGDGPKPFSLDGMRIACFVCYDLRFPEIFRLVAADVDLAVLIASWPSPRQNHFDILLRARAIENQHYVVGVNRVGTGGGLDYTGGTAVFDPMGDRIAYAGDKELLIFADIDRDKIEKTRAFMACHRDRRF